MEDQLLFPYPELIVSNNNKLCLKWEDALKNDNFKNQFDVYDKSDKDRINSNKNNRTCQVINNTKQCFTVEGVMEECGNLSNKQPKNLKGQMGEIKHVLDSKTGNKIEKFDKNIDTIRTILSELINNYKTRQDIKNLSLSHRNVNDTRLINKTEEKTNLGKTIESNEKTVEFTKGDLEVLRKELNWYQKKTNIISRIMKLFLVILVIVNLLFILSKRQVGFSTSSLSY